MKACDAAVRRPRLWPAFLLWFFCCACLSCTHNAIAVPYPGRKMLHNGKRLLRLPNVLPCLQAYAGVVHRFVVFFMTRRFVQGESFAFGMRCGHTSSSCMSTSCSLLQPLLRLQAAEMAMFTETEEYTPSKLLLLLSCIALLKQTSVAPLPPYERLGTEHLIVLCCVC